MKSYVKRYPSSREPSRWRWPFEEYSEILPLCQWCPFVLRCMMLDLLVQWPSCLPLHGHGIYLQYELQRPNPLPLASNCDNRRIQILHLSAAAPTSRIIRYRYVTSPICMYMICFVQILCQFRHHWKYISRRKEAQPEFNFPAENCAENTCIWKSVSSQTEDRSPMRLPSSTWPPT